MNISMGANKFNIGHRKMIAIIGYPTVGEDPLLHSSWHTSKIPKMVDTTRRTERHVAISLRVCRSKPGETLQSMFSCFAVQISWFGSDRNKKHKQVRRILGGAALTRPTAMTVSSAETKKK